MSTRLQVGAGPQLVCVSCRGHINVEEIPLCGACAETAIGGKSPAAPAKTLADWSAIVDSYYAARDAFGHVRQPNWAVFWLQIDPHHGDVVHSECIDVCPALPEEIPAGANPSTTRGAKSPINTGAVASRLGYPATGIRFVLDHTGIHTTRLIHRQRGERGAC